MSTYTITFVYVAPDGSPRMLARGFRSRTASSAMRKAVDWAARHGQPHGWDLVQAQVDQ